MYLRPVCVKCECELQREESGVGLLDMFNPSHKPGPQPYQIWDSDLWKCPKCGYEVIFGFGNDPLARHFEKDEIAHEIQRYETTSKLIKNYE